VNRFLRAWILTIIAKLGMGALLPLTPDETYYWVWSHHLQLSYYDHPPFVAWLFYLGHGFESLGQLVRTPAIIVGHLTLLVWYQILKPRFPWNEYKYWYILALSSPFLGFGSLLVTPDIPLLLFWSLAIYFFQRALLHQKAADYFLLGASLGLGFCAKYHIVLFVPFILLFLFIEKRLREISFKKLLLTFVGGILCSLPVIIWNIQNAFISFKFQLRHGLGSSAWSPEWTLQYVVAEIMLLFPLVFYGALRAHTDREYRFLPYLAWGPLIFFFFSSFRGIVELNWPIAAFPAVFALVLFSNKAQKITRWAGGFWIFFYIFAFSAALFFPKNSPMAKPFRDQFRFRPLAEVQKEFQPLYAGTYQIASTIWYENKQPIYKLRDMSRYDFYDTLSQSMPQEDSFYLIQENWSDLPDWVQKSGYNTTVVKKIEPHFIVVKVSKQ
jgi:4-amino-4-deoxy-L-arabinose transferase-like glycosyltransferase